MADLLTRAGRMLETAATIRETDPSAAVSLAASVVVMAHAAVLHTHGQRPTPAGERRLGAAVTELLGEPLIPGDRLTVLLDARDGVGLADPDEALTDARSVLEQATAAVEDRAGGCHRPR